LSKSISNEFIAALDNYKLSTKDRDEINRLISYSQNQPPVLEDIWMSMDLVWDELRCDNKIPNAECMRDFYRHPVWFLNGIFIEKDKISIQHRHAISDWITVHNNSIKRVLDYGGGFGTLGRLIAEKNPELQIDIFEPCPSKYAIVSSRQFTNINFIKELNLAANLQFECLAAIDVLEHLGDPLETLDDMIRITRINGHLLIANNFFPVIKCHLPRNFHFRFSFPLFAKMMGLKRIGVCLGSHATIYKKVANHPQNWNKIRKVETISQMIFPILLILETSYRHLKKWATS